MVFVHHASSMQQSAKWFFTTIEYVLVLVTHAKILQLSGSTTLTVGKNILV